MMYETYVNRIIHTNSRGWTHTKIYEHYIFNICIFHHIYKFIICLSTQVISTYWVVCAYIWYRVAKTLWYPKLQVIFRTRATNYRAHLRRITYKDKTSYGSSAPCIYVYIICKHGCIYVYAHNLHTLLNIVLYENYVHICICVHVFTCVLKSTTHVILGCGALLTDCRALLIDCKALLIAHHNVCVECKAWPTWYRKIRIHHMYACINTHLYTQIIYVKCWYIWYMYTSHACMYKHTNIHAIYIYMTCMYFWYVYTSHVCMCKPTNIHTI